MTDDLKKLRENLKSIEEGISNLEALWGRLLHLDELERMESKSQIQEIAVKLTAVRELVDKIDIKLDEVEGRIDGIESLKFRSRSEF